MIGTYSRLVLPPSRAPLYEPCCSRRGDVSRNGETDFFKRDFFRGFVPMDVWGHWTLLRGFGTGIKFVGPCSGTRMMAGKGRSYPGGVTKWQWKRRQFKEDRKLERERISRDRKLFRWRRREELKGAEPWVFSLDMSSDDSSSENKVGPINNPLISVPNFGACVENLEEDVSTGAGIQGRHNSKTCQVGWSANKEDELQQIQKVKTLLRSKPVQVSSRKDLTDSSFEMLRLSAPSLRALHRVLGLSRMNHVQQATLPTLVRGKDLLIRSSGTDDILTSVLHGVEVALNTPRHMTVSGRYSVHVLLVCPTREQVEVAGAEARKLLMFHSGIRLQAVMGGSDIKKEMSRLRRSPCEMLVATPGRLLANMQESAELRGQLRLLKLLVLHDVQMLLDMGYQKTVENIISLLPRTCQTVMWSKTLSDEVNTLSHYCLKKDRAVIKTSEGEADSAFPLGKHEYALVPIKMHLAFISRELKAHFEHEPKGKVVIFCQTVRATSFMAELFKTLGFCSREVHMRKKEDVRSRVTAEFRTSKDGMILFTSGASVWGAGNPDVTLIIQVGSPTAREQYVRRVALTVPTTKQRDSMLILMPHERSFLKHLVDLPISQSADFEVGPDLELQVQRAVEGINYQIRAKAYIAWLRYHFTKESTDSGQEKTLCLAPVYASALGFKSPPIVSRKTVARLGLGKNLLSARSEKEEIYS